MKAIRPAIFFILFATLIAGPTDSCSFYEGPSFEFVKRPDAPIAAYASGRLGILAPSFARSHLVVAWRYLMGKPLSDAETKEVLAYYDDRLGERQLPARPERDAIEEWMTARNTIIESKDRPSNYRSAARLNYVVNCTADAFLTAAATLKSRIAEFGIAHPGVHDWVDAQNAVFSNCEHRGSVPEQASASLPATFKLDRDYQIAAAAFYATDFDRAHDLFLAVSRDHASPWRRIARLVAARALIRNATMGNFEGFDRDPMNAADRELRAILADEDMRGLHRAASDLEDYVRLHLAPDEQRAKLEQAIAGGHVTKHILTDFVMSVGEDAKTSGEMSDWINTFKVPEEENPAKTAEAEAHAVERWQATRSLPWLVAALASAKNDDKSTGALLDAAAKVEPSSPAFVMVTYHRARLLLNRGDVTEGKRALDGVLALPNDALGVSTRNLFSELRMPLAASIDDFVRDAARLPAGMDNETIASPPYETLFDTDAATVINEALPISSLIEAARIPKLPDSIRAQLVAAAFTRAIVMGRTDMALSLVPEMHRDFDDDIKEPLNRFAAAPPSRRRIEALDLLLHVPGLSPFVTPYEGRVNMRTKVTALIHGPEHQNWWCVGGLQHFEVIYPDARNRHASLQRPRFAEARAIRDAFASEEKELQISGASFMLRGAITWAKEYPDDARVPEALALAVRGTQWACPDAATAKLASSAFDLLHTRYRTTKWAQQTKHWYSGRD
jgi:hypothetical protein